MGILLEEISVYLRKISGSSNVGTDQERHMMRTILLQVQNHCKNLFGEWPKKRNGTDEGVGPIEYGMEITFVRNVFSLNDEHTI